MTVIEKSRLDALRTKVKEVQAMRTNDIIFFVLR
jgi:hypothetical protein